MARIEDWTGAANRGPTVPDFQLVRGHRYTITGARVLHRPDIVFTVTGTVEAIRLGGQKVELKTDHGVKAEVWKATILTVTDPIEEAA